MDMRYNRRVFYLFDYFNFSSFSAARRGVACCFEEDLVSEKYQKIGYDRNNKKTYPYFLGPEMKKKVFK